MSNSSLVNVWVPAHSTNYSPSSKRLAITNITLHHMAGVLSAEQCGAIFARSGRGGSAHYGVGNDGRIGQYVDESCVAWHCGVFSNNQHSVGIEVSNSSTGGNWPVGDAALESTIRLVADIAKRNGLGRLTPGGNLTWHSMFVSTACPGDYMRSKMQYIADRANEINFPTTKWVAMDTPRILLTKEGSKLVNVYTGKLIKTYNANVELDCNQKITLNNVVYLRTKYSSSNNIDNGFRFDDLSEKEDVKNADKDVIIWEDIEPLSLMTKENVDIINLDDKTVAGTIAAGTIIENLVQKTNISNRVYYRTLWSRDHDKNNGIPNAKLDAVAEPEPETPVESGMEEPTTPPVIDFPEDIIVLPPDDTTESIVPSDDGKDIIVIAPVTDDTFDEMMDQHGMSKEDYDEFLKKLEETDKLLAETAKKYGVSFVMSNKVYDALKFVAQILLPAIATLYVGIAVIWGLPFGAEVEKTILLVVTFLNTVLGLAVAKASSDYKKQQ